ncbi:MAG TPA: DUF2231 domain-containing protein [Casimicrobiaceae bacterium]
MALRIHEVHPSLTHFPLALFPLSIVSDLIGRLTGNRFLMHVGKTVMPVAAVSGVATAAAGLVAQAAVETDGRAHDLLVTHRNLNAALVVATGLMALLRSRRETPGIGYLAAGIGGIVAMNYTAYLGGTMVYERGVGVAPAGGLKDGRAPEIRRDTLPQVAKVAGQHAVHSVTHAVKELRQGEIAPALGGDSR